MREGAAKERSSGGERAREGERGAMVVREVRVRVLGAGDEDKRVAHSEVGHAVNGQHLREAARCRLVDKDTSVTRKKKSEAPLKDPK